LDQRIAHHVGYLLDGCLVLSAQINGLTGETHEIFAMMEYKLAKVIMSPAMMATWLFGLILVATPGIVYWGDVWPWLKAAGVIASSTVSQTRCRRC